VCFGSSRALEGEIGVLIDKSASGRRGDEGERGIWRDCGRIVVILVIVKGEDVVNKVNGKKLGRAREL